MTDTLYDDDRPFGLPVRKHTIPVEDDGGSANAVGVHEVKVIDPREYLPRSATHTYAQMECAACMDYDGSVVPWPAERLNHFFGGCF